MKKTDFTFFQSGLKWTLSMIPVLIFVLLSADASAQNVSLRDNVVPPNGIPLMSEDEAKPVIEAQLSTLEVQTPTTPSEEALQSSRIAYLNYIIGGARTQSWEGHVVNSREFIEGHITRYASAYRPSSAQLYNEMISLLQ